MLNIIAPINQLGYGITGLNIVKALCKVTEVSLWTIGQPQVTTQEDANIVQNCIRNAYFADFNAPCIKIWHQNDMAQFVGRGKRIGFPIFELDKFSEVEQHHLHSLDHIFVCSQWAKNVILNNLRFDEKNVSVIPLGVDSDLFKPVPTNNSGPTVFLNCGKWEIRKGHDVLVQIFNDTFDANDNVELWLLSDNPFLSEEETQAWHRSYYSSKLGSKIKIIKRVNTQEEVYNIMSKCDCGIFPSRAEGWNLELLELMSCGKPVIATEYSAHTEFCNMKNSSLVPINKVEPAYDGKWFFKQGNWAKLETEQLDQFSKYMKQVHQNKLQNTLPENIAGIDTAKKFSWDNTAEKILANV
jgi:glycosyltransferase involved in cell wall biosynthesis